METKELLAEEGKPAPIKAKVFGDDSITLALNQESSSLFIAQTEVEFDSISIFVDKKERKINISFSRDNEVCYRESKSFPWINSNLK